MQSKRQSNEDDVDEEPNEESNEEDTVGNCQFNQCPPVHSGILDITYQQAEQYCKK